MNIEILSYKILYGYKINFRNDRREHFKKCMESLIGKCDIQRVNNMCDIIYCFTLYTMFTFSSI